MRQMRAAEAVDLSKAQRGSADLALFKWVASAGLILQKVERIANRIYATGH